MKGESAFRRKSAAPLPISLARFAGRLVLVYRRARARRDSAADLHRGLKTRIGRIKRISANDAGRMTISGAWQFSKFPPPQPLRFLLYYKPMRGRLRDILGVRRWQNSFMIFCATSRGVIAVRTAIMLMNCLCVSSASSSPPSRRMIHVRGIR